MISVFIIIIVTYIVSVILSIMITIYLDNEVNLKDVYTQWPMVFTPIGNTLAVIIAMVMITSDFIGFIVDKILQFIKNLKRK